MWNVTKRHVIRISTMKDKVLFCFLNLVTCSLSPLYTPAYDIIKMFNVYIYIYVCVCVCMYASHIHFDMFSTSKSWDRVFIQIYQNIWIYTYICVCVCIRSTHTFRCFLPRNLEVECLYMSTRIHGVTFRQSVSSNAMAFNSYTVP
jgi:hypothetical protein